MRVHRMLRNGIIQGLDNIRDKINPKHGNTIYFISSSCATKITFQSQIFNYNEPKDFMVIVGDFMKDFIQRESQNEQTIGFACSAGKPIEIIHELKIEKSNIQFLGGFLSC